MNGKVSIVVPAYNAAPFINRTVKSIQQLSYPDWELIVVDDGSTDDTARIIDAVAASDDRITACHQKNGGEVAARKTGVEHSSGQWIMFVDADDVVPVDAIRLLMAENTTEADIIVGTMRVKRVDDKNAILEEYVWKNKKTGWVDSVEFATGLLLYHIQMSAWAKLYRRTLFDSFVWCLDRDIKQNPDLLMNIGIGAYANRIFVTNKAVCYDYIIHEGSASTCGMMPSTAWFKLFDVAADYLRVYPPVSILEDAFAHYRLERFDGMMRHGVIGFSSSDRHVKEVLQDSSRIHKSNDERKVLLLLRSRVLRVIFDWWQKRKARKG